MKRLRAKMVLLGDTNVGKSSIVLRLLTNKFNEFSTSPTVGASFSTHNVSLADRIVTFEVWDTAGQEYYRSLMPLYYRGAQVAIIVYDITSKASFMNARSWANELQSNAGSQVIIGLAGNKVDKAVERTVDMLEAEAFANENGFTFMEVSAKTGKNIVELLKSLARKVQTEPDRNLDELVDLEPDTKKSLNCC